MICVREEINFGTVISLGLVKGEEPVTTEKEFMKVYPSNDPGSMVKAALATPAAKAMGPDFWPTDINVVTKDNVVTKIDINWTRK